MSLALCWYSNDPMTPTGYGTQTAQVCRRLAKDGHEVNILANYGQIAGIRAWEGCSVWPQGHVQYGLDVLDEQARLANAEVVFTLYDVWVLGNAFEGRRVLSWTPIDHYPPPPQVLDWAKTHETIAMSHFGAKALRDAGVEPVDTIWHGIERVFRPTPSDVRQRMNVPDDAFLVTLPNANIGTTPVRKRWGANLEAVARFMARHDDVYVYLHTDLMRPSGMPLPVIIQALGIPKGRIAVVPPVLYRGGLVGEDEMARIYSASDVVLTTSMGEGFGLTTLEAMACGTPAIVSDFSAQPEVVGDTGWKVPGQLEWDHNQGSWFFIPFTHMIVEALEEAYQQRGTRKDACVAHAAQFDADLLYDTKWRPLMARLEAELHAEPRKGMTNAAKRRAKKQARKAA